MRSSTKKICQSFSHLSNMIDDNTFIFNTEQLEQSIKTHVESGVLLNLLIDAKQLHDLLLNDERLSKDYFKKIEENLSNFQSNHLINGLINLIKIFFEKYLLSSVILRCYIYLHIPTSESGNNEGVNIQLQIIKEIQNMELIIQTNENLFLDYYKKHYEILKYLNKYSSIKDYHLYLIEYEKKIFDDLRSIILQLRTIFLKTYDLIQKNLRKIQIPRDEKTNLLMIN